MAASSGEWTTPSRSPRSTGRSSPARYGSRATMPCQPAGDQRGVGHRVREPASGRSTCSRSRGPASASAARGGRRWPANGSTAGPGSRRARRPAGRAHLSASSARPGRRARAVRHCQGWTGSTRWSPITSGGAPAGALHCTRSRRIANQDRPDAPAELRAVLGVVDGVEPQPGLVGRVVPVAVDDQRLEVVVAGAGGGRAALEPVPPGRRCRCDRLHQLGGEALARRSGSAGSARTDLVEEQRPGETRFLQRVPRAGRARPGRARAGPRSKLNRRRTAPAVGGRRRRRPRRRRPIAPS